jgi:hypothetical protein
VAWHLISDLAALQAHALEALTAACPERAPLLGPLLVISCHTRGCQGQLDQRPSLPLAAAAPRTVHYLRVAVEGLPSTVPGLPALGAVCVGDSVCFNRFAPEGEPRYHILTRAVPYLHAWAHAGFEANPHPTPQSSPYPSP